VKRRLLVLLIVLGIPVSVGAFKVLHPKAPPDLKVYQNREFGYSFQYPATCTFGRMPGVCKQNPPEERPQECLCFLNAEDPNRVFLQTFQEDKDQNVTLSSFTIAQYQTPEFNPPDGIELVPWIKTNFSELYTNVPEKPNAKVGGLSAVSIKVPSSPSTYSFQDILFIKDNKLFCITLLNPTNKGNQELYDQILSSFSWQ
jgi:hypothetical protein